MPGRASGDDASGREIEVQYAAVEEVAHPDRLCAWLHGEIDHLLRSISEVPVAGWNRRLRIEQCRMVANQGSVRLTVHGTVSDRQVDQLVAVSDEPAMVDPLWHDHGDQATKMAVANVFTLLGWLLFPSELIRALGRRRISGRLVRAWHDALREIRVAIDEALSRPPSDGLPTLRKTLRTATVSGLGLCALAALQKVVFRPQQQDDFTAWLGCGFIGIGVFGVVAASGLMLLPSRFYQSERPGMKVARLFGVRSLVGIRVVAGGLVLLALGAFLVPGLWMRFWN